MKYPHLQKLAERTFYHYAPNEVTEDIAQYGLLSPKGLRESGLLQRYSDVFNKYRERTKNYNQQQDDHIPTNEEVAQYLKALRGEGWDEDLYAFDNPIPEDAAPRFKRFTQHHKLYKIKVPDNNKLYTYLPENPQDFSKDPVDKILFADIPHYGVRIGSGIKPEADETQLIDVKRKLQARYPELDAISSHKFKLGPSDIAGTGAFSTADIAHGEVLGVGIKKIDTTGKPDVDFSRTSLGRYVNHSDTPNLTTEQDDGNYYFVATKNITPGEELTVNYNEFEFEGKIPNTI